MDFPSNSHSAKSPEPKRVEQVTVNPVMRRKKPLGKRLTELFIGGDTKSVGEYIFLDVILPAIKDTIADAGSQFLDRMLFGDSRSGSRRSGYRSSGSGSQVSYNRVFSSPSGQRQEERPGPRRSRSAYELDDVVLSTRAEAEGVVDKLYEILSKYGHVTVADLYESVGISGEPIDNKWGWTELKGTDIRRTQSGYLLLLPKTEPIS
jgi:hypothetical protein